MADFWDKLTDAEKCYWQIYERLRQLSDWAGFTEGQGQIKDTARSWLVAQRKEIWRQAQPKADGGDGQGWDVNNRRERYAQLDDDSLNVGEPHNLCQLPTGGGTATEKVKISEREAWWNQSSVDDQTKSWRSNNVAWLTDRRKQIYSLGESGGWDTANRDNRYSALCISTKTGKSYEAWSKSHDPVSGADNPPPPSAPPPEVGRAKAVSLARSHLGVNENPSGSNRGTPQPSGWQKRVYGSDGVPWCACFTTCMAWDAGVKGGGSAGVAVIVSMAQKGQGMFRGWTTDPSKVLPGDMIIIGCSSCHVGMVAEKPGTSTTIKTVEGNTAPGSEGSQYNGGCVASRTRQRGEWVGFALVDFP